MITYVSERLSQAEEIYLAIDRDIVALVRVSEYLKCYLEGAYFEIVTDNQVLKQLFDKKHLSQLESGWVHCLSSFIIFLMALEKGKGMCS